MRGRRLSVVALAVAAVWFVGCRDVPAPEGGILSVSRVILPSPGLVVGDTMRDSLGLAAPLRVIAYTVSGDSASPQPQATFVLLDTGAVLANDTLIGEDAGIRVRVVGTVAGLQTQPESVTVTLSPDTIVPSDTTRHERTVNLLVDTIATIDLNTTVHHDDGGTLSGVDAVIVRYELVRSPPSNALGPAVVLTNGTVPSTRDTTSNGGKATRTIRFRVFNFSDQYPDSAIVNASASYRGQSLGTVQFTIVFKNQ
jgi:hypothetical protein